MRKEASLLCLTGLITLTAVSLLMVGCGSSRYVTPGRPAEMASFSDTTIADRWSARPAAQFPVSIAAVRVQEVGYRSRTASGYGYGNYSVITTRDIETDEHFQKINALDQVAGLATMNRLLLSNQLKSDVELRQAAAALQADMVLIYTLDTTFDVNTKVPYAGVLSLGLLPDREARVISTASGLLIDTRTGFIYAAVEATATEHQIASLWTSADAVDASRIKAEKAAFDQLVDHFVEVWPTVTSRFGG